jgi:hypothetical protein
MLYPLIEQKTSGLDHLLNARNWIYEANFGRAGESLVRALKNGSLEVRARALLLYLIYYPSLKNQN